MGDDRRNSVDTATNEKQGAFPLSPVTPTETIVGKESHPPSEKGHKDVEAKPPVVESDLKPVSFFSLFQFATKTELALNAIGLVCAAAAGAAQARH
jgi:ATP-binding cassette subfamily B (MDR/TAP) protein 1